MFRASQEKIDAISAFVGVLAGVFCIMPFSLGFSNVLLIIRLGFWVLGGGKTTEKKYLSHMISRIYAIKMNHHC